MIRKNVLMAILLACVVSGAAAEDTPVQYAWKVTTPLVFTNAASSTIPYRQAVDKGDGTKPVPLVLFLHGAGERGTSNGAQLVHGVGSILQYAKRKGQPLILLAPQCPTGQQWVDTPWGITEHPIKPQPSASLALVFELLDAKLAEFPEIDRDRVYVTGISMGGYGTWDVISRRAKDFAAAIPVCGGGDPAVAERFAKLPIWAFHGDADGVVPVKNTRQLVAELWKLNGKIRYREYPGMGHNVWTKTYADDTVLDWLFSQRRAQ